MPDMKNLEKSEETAQDAYLAITNGNKDRMAYVTGKVAKEIYEKREKMGPENFRKYYKDFLLNKKK